MRRVPLKSKFIKSVGYQVYNSILEIEFCSGSIYQYLNVPIYIYDSFLNASSIGYYFRKVIACKFKYKEVNSNSYTTYVSPEKEVIESVTLKEVKDLYHKLALKFHPDRTKGYEELMKDINNFYKEGNYYCLKQIALKYKV
jgi:hypothetical protein